MTEFVTNRNPKKVSRKTSKEKFTKFLLEAVCEKFVGLKVNPI